jgi:uncharacterized protein YcbX
VLVRELWRYPVKSFLGERLDEVALDARGVVGDRAYAVRDANGKLGSGKTTRRFRLLKGLFEYSARTDDDGVVVGTHCVGDPELDALLSARYGEPLAVLPEEAVPHFDAGAVHVLTTATLEWVRHDVRRFRPNIVLESPEREEEWLGRTLRIGSCVLRVVDRVERCAMVNFAQDDLAYDAGLLRYLTRENDTMLGIHADVVTPGVIRVGDYASYV